LNGIPFAIQTRQMLLSHALKKADGANETRRILISYLDLILAEKKKGWVSHDCAFRYNFGMKNGQAHRLDVGSYVPASENFSWPRITKPVMHWLKQSNPALVSWFDAEIHRREGM